MKYDKKTNNNNRSGKCGLATKSKQHSSNVPNKSSKSRKRKGNKSKSESDQLGNDLSAISSGKNIPSRDHGLVTDYSPMDVPGDLGSCSTLLEPCCTDSLSEIELETMDAASTVDEGDTGPVLSLPEMVSINSRVLSLDATGLDHLVKFLIIFILSLALDDVAWLVFPLLTCYTYSTSVDLPMMATHQQVIFCLELLVEFFGFGFNLNPLTLIILPVPFCLKLELPRTSTDLTLKGKDRRVDSTCKHKHNSILDSFNLVVEYKILWFSYEIQVYSDLCCQELLSQVRTGKVVLNTDPEVRNRRIENILSTIESVNLDRFLHSHSNVLSNVRFVANFIALWEDVQLPKFNFST
jgi:hypothetical protein